MRTALVALNAKYTHSSLALRYLKAYCGADDIVIKEYTINDDVRNVFASLLEIECDVYCFSCYIWNVEQTLKVAQLLKIACPQCVIAFGGPECSYNTDEFLRDNSFVDYVMMGEGEETFKELYYKLCAGNEPSGIAGLAGRGFKNPWRTPLDLATVSFPYEEKDFQLLKDKIIYFETSRGCPFGCSYCLSSANKGVRYFPMEWVKNGLQVFFDHRVPLVKLVDRTFNCNEARAVEIMEYILANSKETRVHFELAPQLLTDKIIVLLQNAPSGLFQVEMGVQSTNPKTLAAIGRDTRANLALDKIARLGCNENVPVHLDLIAGLPWEDYASFGRSFDDVYRLRPQMLQLGFLKVLHGTGIEQEQGCKHAAFPPYEVVSTQWLSAREISALKDIENAVERFYNSGAFCRAIEYLTTGNPFAVFEKLAALLKTAESSGPVKRARLYDILFEYGGEEVLPQLAMDFLQNNKGIAMPKYFRRKEPEGFKQACLLCLKDERFLEKYHIEPDFKSLRFEPILESVFMADYQNNKIYDISGNFSVLY